MDQQKVLIAIVGMTLVTYGPRLLPAWLLSRASLPQGVQRWLRFVPVAVLSALLWPGLLLKDGVSAFHLTADNLPLMASVPTAVVALISRSFLGTVVVGVATVACTRYLLNL